MKIVSPAEYLEIVAIGHQCLSDIVDLLRLLTLSPSLGEDHIGLNVEVGLVPDIALHANEAGLLGMLQIEAMALGDLAVDGLLYPGYLVNQSVAVLIKHVESKSVLVVDDPDE